MIVPNPESALNEEAGRLLLEQYEEYAKHAKVMTSVYAIPTTCNENNSNNSNNNNTMEKDSITNSGANSQQPQQIKKKNSKFRSKKSGLKRL